MTWDFSNNLNWDLVRRQTYYAQLITADGNQFSPIPPITIPVDSYLLLIGCQNPNAKSSWYLAGYASNRLLFSPSSTSEFTAAVQSYSGVRLGLNRLNLVKFKDFDLLPHLLEIKLASWHKEMLIEVWKYSGTTDNIEGSLARIEQKIDTQFGQ